MSLTYARCLSRSPRSPEVQCEKPAGHADYHVHGIDEASAPAITAWGLDSFSNVAGARS